jgi:hypothetical protein
MVKIVVPILTAEAKAGVLYAHHSMKDKQYNNPSYIVFIFISGLQRNEAEWLSISNIGTISS